VDPRSSYLVIRMSSIGDIVLTEPVVACLRAADPDAEIGFVVKERYVDLVRGNPAIARIHALRDGSARSLSSLCRDIGRRRYEVLIDLHANLRSLFLARCVAAGVVTRYRKRARGDAVRVRIGRAAYRADRRLVDRYLDTLSVLGIECVRRRPRFHLDDRDVESAGRLLSEFGLEHGSYAVIVPGSKWPTKTWPADRFAEVASALASEEGLRILVLGSRGESVLAERVASGAPGAVNAAGRTSLGETAALLSGARLAVGNDSGPTHIAMALDTPTVAIFGPTDPSQFDFEGHELAYADLPCSACSFFGTRRCRLGHWLCMRTIPARDVVAAARGLLARGGTVA